MQEAITIIAGWQPIALDHRAYMRKAICHACQDVHTWS